MVHIRTVTQVAVTELAFMLLCRTEFLTNGTILALHLTFVVIACTHRNAAYLAEGGVDNYITAGDILHTAVAALVLMLTVVKTAYLIV